MRTLKNLNVKLINCCASILILTSVGSIWAENAAKDPGGEFNNIVRELQTSVANENKLLRDAQSQADQAFTQIQTLTPLETKMQIPQIGTTSTSGNSSGPVLSNGTSKPSTSANPPQDEERAKVNAMKERHKDLITSLESQAKDYANLSNDEKLKVEEQMKELVSVTDYLNNAPYTYVASVNGRPDFSSRVKALGASLDEAGRSKLNSLNSSESGSPAASEDENQNTSNSNGKPTENVELTGIDLIRSKCAGSVGSKNGYALVKHLTSGECGKALDADPELKAKFNIKKIVELISAWGFRTASFNAEANAAIGLNKLPELGLIFDYKNPKSEFVAMPYQPAVEVQQSQILTTSDKSSAGPLKELGSGSTDKPALNNQMRD